MNERDQRLLNEIVAARRRDRFADAFVDRATTRWRAERDARTQLDATVVRQFWRFAPLAAAAVMFLAVHNIRNRQGEQGQTVVAALFGIAPAPLPITLDQLYGLGTLTVSGTE